MRQLKGNQLEFISRIHRDGDGTSPIDAEYTEILQDVVFDIICLSMSYGTYIAHEFNSFIVKIKE